MYTIQLQRLQQSDLCTRGVILLGDELLTTLELPWKSNSVGESCIPAGKYTCTKRISPRYGETYHITEVVNRTLILIHAGNTSKDTEGCILLGGSFGTLGYQPAVLSSRKALRRFEHIMSDKDFILEIFDVPVRIT